MPNTDKTIFLPQLQRYDQKIKGWADNKFLTKVDTPSLPKATATTLGGVKVGNGLNVTDDGTLSASSTGGLPVVEVTPSTTGYIPQEQYDAIAASWPNVMIKLHKDLYMPKYKDEETAYNMFWFGTQDTFNPGSIVLPRTHEVSIRSDTLALFFFAI